MSEVAAETLHLVNRELARTLQEARQTLEIFTENPDSLQPLRQCTEHLHTAQGVLRMVEIYGAALLAEEMEQAAHYLIETSHDQQHRSEALDALMRAMVQLPTYLDRVLGGGRDIALVLLPLLNDLRAVRGNPLLSEGTLLLLNLKSDKQAAPAPTQAGAPTDLPQIARRLRPRFQLSLLGWIRGEKPDSNLEVMAKVAARLEKSAANQSLFQLWWVVGAVLEALRQGGLDSSVSIKRLLAQTDRELKRLIDRGESDYDSNSGGELVNNLLYYVARATTSGQRVTAVRSSFNLSDVLPAAEQVDRARETLSAPSLKLMKTVAAAIKEDLARVKDVLDIFVRTGMGQVEELTPQLDMLKKIADTLGVLGLGELRGRIQAEIDQLKTIISEGESTDDSALLQIAATLLSVEDSLDEHLLGLIVGPREGGAESPVDDLAATADDIEFKQVTQAVIRECIVNLARIKEAITMWVEKPDEAQAIEQVPHQLRGIIAALLMLGKTRAVELVERFGKFITTSMRPGKRPLTQDKLDRLADAIVSVEYYMETLQSGRSDPWYMLDNAEGCIEALQLPYEADLEISLEGEVEGYAKTVKLDQKEKAEMLRPPEAERAAPPAAPSVTPSTPVLAAEGAKLDPEFLELFIEEAKEEVASIAECFPKWAADSEDTESLVTVRRSLHTLKGSGRVVGAQLIGEFAWAIENLLNRVLSGTLERSPEMVEFVGRSVTVLPQLVEQLEAGTTPKADIAEYIRLAQAFARADPDAPIKLQSLGSTAVPAESPEVATMAAESAPSISPSVAPERLPAEPREPMDPVLQEIFSRETTEHLGVIKDFLESCRDDVPPYQITEAMYRSCHTLAGSSKMAGAKQGVKLVEPLDRYVRRLYDEGKGLPEAGWALCRDIVDALEEVIRHINEGTGYFKTHSDLIARLQALEDVPVTETRTEEAVAPAVEEPSGESAPDLPRAAITESAPSAELPAEFDAEIAGIFSEEAAEVLENADAALAAWAQNTADTTRLGELQRCLHTLKGGARMAGIKAMGDLSHELESLLIDIQAGQVAASETTRGLLQASVDELHQMRDAVSHGMGVAPAADLLARIRELMRPQPVAPLEIEAEPPPRAETESPLDALARELGEPAEVELPIPADEASSAAEELLGEALGEPVGKPTGEPAEELAVTPPPVGPPVELEEAPKEEPSAAPGPPEAAPVPPGERPEYTRVATDLLDEMLNNAGEISILRGRLEQQVNTITFNLAELSRVSTRLRDQLRKLEMETEAQILHRHQDESASGDEFVEFDPLELDRYSAIQQFSRALAESVSDVGSVQSLLENLSQETENLLLQQARATTELQTGLMRTRMVPFERHVPRLARLVRQTATEVGKRVELDIEGGSGELDRQVLERMLPPFEHMLRNAVIHGIEPPDRRVAGGKPELGHISVRLHREGAEMVIDIADDGAGMNVDAIRQKAGGMGLLKPGQTMPDEEALQLILEPGFSTAGSLTQAAGRGVGMDVVATEVKKLGGSLSIAAARGRGTTFSIRLPFTLAITQALIVRAGNEVYAVPLPTVEGVTRIPVRELRGYLKSAEPSFEYGEQRYRFEHLGLLVGGKAAALPEDDSSVSVILVQAGERSTALIADELVGSREIVVKSVGPQIAAIRGISGATILGDGRVAIILDVGALVRAAGRVRTPIPHVTEEEEDQRTFALVVDDSITVRRVTQRLLERNGMRVMTAKDGMDALSILQEHTPDIVLLDIEMPRMDGYEVASHVRNDERLKEIPIVMITSRVGEKHRARAIEIGVNDYLGKPYQESQLLEAIAPLVRKTQQ